MGKQGGIVLTLQWLMMSNVTRNSLAFRRLLPIKLIIASKTDHACDVTHAKVMGKQDGIVLPIQWPITSNVTRKSRAFRRLGPIKLVIAYKTVVSCSVG